MLYIHITFSRLMLDANPNSDMFYPVIEKI